MRAKRVRRAIGVAKLDGWATAVFAGLTLIGGLFHWIGLVLGLGMAIVAIVEFIGAARLRRLDASAARMLAMNQVFLGAMLLAYAIYSLWAMTTRTTYITTQLSSHPELAHIGVEVEALAKLIGWVIYGTLAAVAIVVQGGTAMFYLSRRKHVEAYMRDTPAWIVQAQRAGLPM